MPTAFGDIELAVENVAPINLTFTRALYAGGLVNVNVVPVTE